MHVWINGNSRELADGASVADAVADLGTMSAGVAVAVDAEVVPRTDWPRRRLSEGSRVEVLTAVQGG
jgi:sulfur carrier protein